MSFSLGDRWVGQVTKLRAADVISEYEKNVSRILNPPHYVEVGLDLLLRDLQTSAHLNALGHRIAGTEIVRWLGTWTANPHQGSALEPARRRVAIAGLPRTGTTYLHERLAGQPGWSSIPHWQMNVPGLVRSSGEYAADRESAERRLQFLRAAVPNFDTIHPIRIDKPDECNVALQQTFCSPQFGVMFFVPQYTEWLRNSSTIVDALRWYGDCLERLATAPSHSLILKSPFYIWWYREVVEQLKLKAAIQVYRDPETVLGSWCSLVHTLRSAFARSDPKQVGREWSVLWLSAVISALIAKDDLGTRLTWLNVDFDSLVGSARTMSALLEQLGSSATPRYVSQKSAADRPGRRHEYDVDSFGIKANVVAQLRNAYGELCQPLLSG